jgi:hypothetical protein
MRLDITDFLYVALGLLACVTLMVGCFVFLERYGETIFLKLRILRPENEILTEEKLKLLWLRLRFFIYAKYGETWLRDRINLESLIRDTFREVLGENLYISSMTQLFLNLCANIQKRINHILDRNRGLF